MTAPAIAVLADDLGPRGRRRVAIATAVSAVLVAAAVAVIIRRLAARGQLDADLWRPLAQWSVARFLLLGLGNTLRAALTAMALALPIGLLMAVGRLSPVRIVAWVSGIYVEFFRAVPLILLILFCGVGLPQYGLRWSAFWFLVAALVAYNSAVLGEIFRAGILSLDRGQSEAAAALGLTWSQAMRLILLPQAIRRMVPAVVSQLVTLLKDTALGFVITYEELLRRSRSTGEFFHNPLQTLVVVAVMYIVVNFALGRVAVWLEHRQRRRRRAAVVTEPPVLIDDVR